MIEFITVKTLTNIYHEPRNVTIHNGRDGFVLLGNLEHGTRLLIDQELIDQLQKLVDEKKGYTK